MKNKTFTAIDFETAQGYRHTICQVGLIRYEDGEVTKELSMLVQPPDNYYWYQFTNDIHGISAEDTKNSPGFDKVWPLIKPFIEGQVVVAHNSAFDFSCLRKTLEFYNMPLPNFDGHCTYRIYKDNLASLCRKYKIDLNHHDALSDAKACALLFLKAT